jgi:hypothetical protein
MSFALPRAHAHGATAAIDSGLTICVAELRSSGEKAGVAAQSLAADAVTANRGAAGGYAAGTDRKATRANASATYADAANSARAPDAHASAAEVDGLCLRRGNRSEHYECHAGK